MCSQEHRFEKTNQMKNLRDRLVFKWHGKIGIKLSLS